MVFWCCLNVMFISVDEWESWGSVCSQKAVKKPSKSRQINPIVITSHIKNNSACSTILSHYENDKYRYSREAQGRFWHWIFTTSDSHNSCIFWILAAIRIEGAMGKGFSSMVEHRICNPKVMGSSHGVCYHLSLVLPSQKSWSPAGSGKTMNRQTDSNNNRQLVSQRTCK